VLGYHAVGIVVIRVIIEFMWRHWCCVPSSYGLTSLVSVCVCVCVCVCVLYVPCSRTLFLKKCEKIEKYHYILWTPELPIRRVVVTMNQLSRYWPWHRVMPTSLTLISTCSHSLISCNIGALTARTSYSTKQLKCEYVSTRAWRQGVTLRYRSSGKCSFQRTSLEINSWSSEEMEHDHQTANRDAVLKVYVRCISCILTHFVTVFWNLTVTYFHTSVHPPRFVSFALFHFHSIICFVSRWNGELT
jgi:hypothetical protein